MRTSSIFNSYPVRVEKLAADDDFGCSPPCNEPVAACNALRRVDCSSNPLDCTFGGHGLQGSKMATRQQKHGLRRKWVDCARNGWTALGRVRVGLCRLDCMVFTCWTATRRNGLQPGAVQCCQWTALVYSGLRFMQSRQKLDCSHSASWGTSCLELRQAA